MMTQVPLLSLRLPVPSLTGLGLRPPFYSQAARAIRAAPFKFEPGAMGLYVRQRTLREVGGRCR